MPFLFPGRDSLHPLIVPFPRPHGVITPQSAVNCNVGLDIVHGRPWPAQRLRRRHRVCKQTNCMYRNRTQCEDQLLGAIFLVVGLQKCNSRKSAQRRSHRSHNTHNSPTRQLMLVTAEQSWEKRWQLIIVTESWRAACSIATIMRINFEINRRWFPANFSLLTFIDALTLRW